MGATKEINGLPIKDAKRRLEVTITPSDVKAGAKKNAQMCAAAIAICRQNNFTEARVHLGRTYVRDGNAWLRFNTPPALKREIVSFDRGGTFEPGDYALNPPSPADTSAGRAKRAQIAPKHPPKTRRAFKKRPRHVTTGIRHNFAG